MNYVFNNRGGFPSSTSQRQGEASSAMTSTSSFTDCTGAPVQSHHHQQLTCRRKQRPSYSWLHRDLTLEDEYNIAAVDGEDLDNISCSRSQPTASTAASKPFFTPHSRPSEEQGRSLQRVRRTCRAEREVHYTEYHLHEWYTNFSDVKRRIKHISYVALFEPCAVTVTDIFHTTVTEDTGWRSLKRPISSDVYRDTEERHLPLKKRKSCDNTTRGGSNVDTVTSPAAQSDQPSASRAAFSHAASAPATATEHHSSSSSSLSNSGSRRHATNRHDTWDNHLPLKKNTTC